MISKKLAFVATTALVGSLMAASGAFAQSTGTTEVEQVVVTASSGPKTLDGLITAETAPKSKSSIDQEFISTQAAGQTIAQSLNLTPGLNFTNNDPYGASGGNIRIRGFDGNRISLTFDGVPLNDTGNYAIFTNQQLDPEIIQRASVNLGTTDVDSPTASATGGTINYSTRKPGNEFGLMVQPSVGSYNFRRIFGMVDSGEIGPFGTTAFLAASYQKYDKFRGTGELEKKQYNGRVYQPLGDNGDFVAVGFNWNENRNSSYRSYSAAAFKFYGNDYDYISTCNRPSNNGAAAGTTQNDNAAAPASGSFIAPGDNPAGPSSCTNFQGVRLNPSNTGNIRVQSKFHLMDNLVLTIDPSFQYVLANGGGSTTVGETTGTARGNTLVVAGPPGSNPVSSGLNCPTVGLPVVTGGFDLNGDGDVCDTVRFYSPSNTNTRRYGVLSSLIWDLDENNRIRLAYTNDYGRHRQTGEYTSLDGNDDPLNPFGGKDGQGAKVYNANGYFMRSRDRFSEAILNQFAVEYRGQFMDDALLINLGLRAPFFKRNLNQYCYTQNSSTDPLQPSGSFVTCTSSDVTSTSLTNGTVTLRNQSGTYIKPFTATVKYDKVLPNLGVSYKFENGMSIYGSYAEGFSAPRTDQLYTAHVDIVTPAAGLTPAVTRTLPADVKPETTKAYDLGWRYSQGPVIASAAIWKNNYKNRIVTSFDPDTGVSVDRNVGGVKMWGAETQAGWQINEAWSVFGSLAYTKSELEENLRVGTAGTLNGVYAAGSPLLLPTKGKELVETPEWTSAVRITWDATESLHFGFQGKHVGDRYATDVNDERSSGYNIFDLDARWDLPGLGKAGSFLQLNVTNLFDKEYFGSISSGTVLNPIPGVVYPGSSVPANTGGILTNSSFYQIGAPRTVQLTLRAMF
jgi:iron complex outermembrane receptor protein